MEVVDESFGARQANAHAAGGRVAVLHRRIDRGYPWSVILKGDAKSVTPRLPYDLQTHHTTAAVHDGIARQLARRGHDLREIEHRESQLARPVSDTAACGNDIDVAAKIEARLLVDDDRRDHDRAAAARSTSAIPRSTSNAV